MANKKQPYTWNQVKPGDIISFRYRTKSTGKVLMHSVLEESNRIELRLNRRQVDILNKTGELVPVNAEENIYKIKFKNRFVLNDVKGVKPKVYDLVSRSDDIKGLYRTYDYLKVNIL